MSGMRIAMTQEYENMDFDGISIGWNGMRRKSEHTR